MNKYNLIEEQRRLSKISLLSRSAIITAGLFFLVAANNLQSNAQSTVNFPKMPPGFRIGMEIELTQEALANLVHLFNLDLEQAGRHLAGEYYPEYYKDYLQNAPEELETIKTKDPDLYKKLTEGLDLQNLIETKTPTLIKEELKMEQKGGGIILPSAKRELIRSAEPVIKSSQGKGELKLPKRLDWVTLNNRWNDLNPEAQGKIVRWQKLAPDKKAKLIIEKLNGNVKLRSDLPEKIANVFKNFTWSVDARALEFRHNEYIAVTSLEDFYKQVSDFLEFAGVEAKRKILRPDLYDSGIAGLHYHISQKGRALNQIGSEINDLIFIKKIANGHMEDLISNNEYGYSPGANSKGLVRNYAADRFEVRGHPWPLDEELHLVGRLFLADDQEALKIVHAEISKYLTQDVLEKIVTYRPDYLDHLKPYFSKETLVPFKAQLRDFEYFTQAQKKIPADFESRALELIQSKSIIIRLGTADLLSLVTISADSNLWEYFRYLLSSTDKADERLLVSVLDGQIKRNNRVIPSQNWDAFFGAFRASHDNFVRYFAVQALVSAVNKDLVPNQAKSHLFALFDSGETELIHNFLDHLCGLQSFSKEFWAPIFLGLKKVGDRKTSFLLQLATNQETWPPEFWDGLLNHLEHEGNGMAEFDFTNFANRMGIQPSVPQSHKKKLLGIIDGFSRERRLMFYINYDPHLKKVSCLREDVQNRLGL